MTSPSTSKAQIINNTINYNAEVQINQQHLGSGNNVENSGNKGLKFLKYFLNLSIALCLNIFYYKF